MGTYNNVVIASGCSPPRKNGTLMEIQLRNVIGSDLPILYEHQADPVASQMAAFPARDRNAFMAHWAKILKNESNVVQTIVYDGQVAGTVMSFEMEGKREVGYWIGREYWASGLRPRRWQSFWNTRKHVRFMVM